MIHNPVNPTKICAINFFFRITIPNLYIRFIGCHSNLKIPILPIELLLLRECGVKHSFRFHTLVSRSVISKVHTSERTRDQLPRGVEGRCAYEEMKTYLRNKAWMFI